MIKLSAKCLSVWFFFFYQFLFPAAITYEFSGGRFGDNLLAYLHAKWLSFQYNIPFVYKPFKYSNELFLDIHEKMQNVSIPDQIKSLTRFNMVINKDANFLYIVPYFSEVKTEYKINPHWIYFRVDWESPVFKEIIKTLVSPIKKSLNHPVLPTDSTTIALHIRRGGGYDAPLAADKMNLIKNACYADLRDPLKFPPLRFYIQQLKQLIIFLLDEKPIYIYIFTDDQEPESLLEKIKSEFSEFSHIRFDCRKEDNSYDKNVLEDFFFMTKFDYLIRPQSNFSLIAAKIANYKIEIFPINAHIDVQTICIDKIRMRVRNPHQTKIYTFNSSWL